MTEELLRRGHGVRCIDDLSTGSINNIEPFKGRVGYAYTIGTVFDVGLMAELVDWSDVVVHLAAVVGVQIVVDDPVRTIETNVHGTETVLAAAAKKKRRTIIASTSEVYGKGSGGGPFREDCDLVFGATDKARWAYACSKAIDEFLAIAYWRQKGVPTTIVRLFNTVGPRQTGQYGMVIPSLVGQALRGSDMTVFGNGRQTRCFALVTEVVKGIADLIGCKKSHGLVVNLGNNEEISMLGLARRIRSLTRTRSKIVLVSYDKAYSVGFEDMQRRVPDLARARRLIGYRPKATLDDILKSVIGSMLPQPDAQ